MEIMKRSRKSLKFDVDVGEAMNNVENNFKKYDDELNIIFY